MKTRFFLFGLFVGLILALAIHLDTVEIYKTDIEIYTRQNIYFVNGLEVTNEQNNIILTFKNKANLKEYISQITATENN